MDPHKVPRLPWSVTVLIPKIPDSQKVLIPPKLMVYLQKPFWYLDIDNIYSMISSPKFVYVQFQRVSSM